jgi:hypothetical protein
VPLNSRSIGLNNNQEESMSFISRPNAGVSKEVSVTKLTYALRVKPAPITVSIPHVDPVLASLEFVVTNPTKAALSVVQIGFTIEVGPEPSLSPSTDGIKHSVSNPNNWIVTGPPSRVDKGPATYKLEPSTGTAGTIEAGASLVVKIAQIQTNTTPCNTVVKIKEIVDSTPGFTSFQVTTFPAGFYLNGLTATIRSGSALVPVAQVDTGSKVILVWNSSVVDPGSFEIYYSNASLGQQHSVPTQNGEWTSPELTSDTVFTVLVTVHTEVGEPLTASMTTAISVQNPSLIAASITAKGKLAANSVGIGTSTPGFPLTF